MGYLCAVKFASLVMLLFVLAACGGSRYYKQLDAQPHPAYVHHMEMILAPDMADDDSATSTWAKEFFSGFESGYRSCHPDIKVIEKLKRFADSLEVKVIGGNWCSDTRYQVPRLCKVLAYAGMPEQKFGYFTVGKDKKALHDDFASVHPVVNVPTVVVFYGKQELGHIVEVPATTFETEILKLLTAGKSARSGSK